MYELYITNKNYSSWSLRPWVLMRELSIPFEERLVLLEPGSSWEAFRKFSPTGRVPCLVDAGTAIWDSLAIAEYLAERNPGVWPSDPKARAWARCASAEMHSSFAVLRDLCGMSCGVRVMPRELPETLLSDFARIEELWSDGIERFGGPFLAGAAFSAVDAFFAPLAFRFQTYGIQLDRDAAKYSARLLALDSMQAWYAAALAEPWREPAHEADVRRYGTVLQDLRAAPIG